MGKQDIDKRKLMVTGAHASTEIPHVRVESDQDDVFIIVTQAYGPAGDSLVGLSEVTFDGFPAVTLKVRVNGQEGLVHLSPFHGDPRKEGFVEIPDGAICELMCPVSGLRLDDLGEVSPGSEARYCAIYLTPSLSRGEVVAVSNVWGDYRSRIVDGAELISSWGVAS